MPILYLNDPGIPSLPPAGRSPNQIPTLLNPASAPASPSEQTVIITERDIVFDCPHCHFELVVDRAGIGMTLACSHCGHALVVPSLPSASAPPAVAVAPGAGSTSDSFPKSQGFDFSHQPPEQIRKRIEELKFQFKENQSQTTEMRGHVNRATIELHRLQLKLQKLQERQTTMEAELLAAKTALEKAS